jgi:hypothetical protein
MKTTKSKPSQTKLAKAKSASVSVNKAPKGDTRTELLQYLNEVFGAPPAIREFGPKARQFSIARAKGYPEPSLTTLVTIGVSRLGHTMWRGLDVGYEVTLTIPNDDISIADRLAEAVMENFRREITEDRRPFVNDGEVFAPGYPPYFFFTTDLTRTPKLTGRHRFGEIFVDFLSAILISDAELRVYDRNASSLVKQLRKGGRLLDYPRD